MNNDQIFNIILGVLFMLVIGFLRRPGGG